MTLHEVIKILFEDRNAAYDELEGINNGLVGITADEDYYNFLLRVTHLRERVATLNYVLGLLHQVK